MQRMERADMNWNLKKLSQLSVSIFNDMPEKLNIFITLQEHFEYGPRFVFDWLNNTY